MKLQKKRFISGVMIRFTIIWTLCITAIYAQPENEESVLLGLNVPLTGPYHLQGQDQAKAYQLAIEILNQEKGGILGKKIKYEIMDTKTDPETAKKNAEELIKNGAVMVTGGSSSASAIAQIEVCEANKIIYMAGLSHSNATTGVKASRYSFRWYNNAHQTTRVLSKSLFSSFEENLKCAYIYSDYIWGQEQKDELKTEMEKFKSQTILELATPLGTKDFTKELTQVMESGADILMLVEFGDDLVKSLKQAKELGLKQKMRIIAPLMDTNVAMQAGPEALEGIYTTMCWYHGLGDIFSGSKQFVEKFKQRWNNVPGSAAAIAWVNIFQYAEAVERAGTFNSEVVIEALEDWDFEMLVGPEYWRGWDHQGIHPTFVAIGKSPNMIKDESDFFILLNAESGDNIARTQQENPVHLGQLVS